MRDPNFRARSLLLSQKPSTLTIVCASLTPDAFSGTVRPWKAFLFLPFVFGFDMHGGIKSYGAVILIEK
jgi:hypothetical protein